MMILLFMIAPVVIAADEPHSATIVVRDEAPYHVHSAGKPFTVEVTPSVAVRAWWEDWRGEPLSQPLLLKAHETRQVHSPEAIQVGYYGLTFQAVDPDVLLEREAFGFVAPPPLPERATDATSPFGIVHADLHDPYLRGGWIKTLVANHPPESWRQLMEERRQLGLLELPLVVGKLWDSDSTKPVPASHLETLYTTMKQILQADPTVLYWELGIEENLGLRQNRKAWTHYWPNLVAKFQAVRRAADEVNPQIRLIYQIEGFDYQTVEDLCRSGTIREVDILSLHPYRWPDFPPPETWLPQYVQKMGDILRRWGVERPIWFTEIGAPHHGNPRGFFGYPEKGAAVKGKSRKGGAVYLIQCHILAFHAGVEKVFWYNYRDRGSSREHAEDHFGLVDYWGFPKPAYAAYVTLRRLLHGKTPGDSRELPNGVRVFPFRGRDEDCLVVWGSSEVERAAQVSLASLYPGLTPKDEVEAVNAVGTPLPLRNGTIRIGEEPLYLVVRRQ